MPTTRPLFQAAFWLAGLTALLHPLFFVLYRLSVFNTLPRDDYAGFLLWTVGNPQGALPPSPYCYRILSMLLAAPLYFVSPPLRLSNMPPDLSAPYLRATAALSALSLLAWIVGAMLIYQVAVRRCGLARRDGLLAGVLMFALGPFCQIAAIDPLTIALIALGVALLHRRYVFAGFVLVSIVANEKIALVFAIWLTIRCVLSARDRAALVVPWVACLLAVAGYIALLKFLPMPGNLYQVTPADYPQTLRENLAAWASGRGLLLNLLPTLVLGTIALFGARGAPRGAGALFRRADVLVIPALVVVALLLTQLFQAGRIVMHAAPLFVIPAVAASGTWLNRASAAPTG